MWAPGIFRRLLKMHNICLFVKNEFIAHCGAEIRDDLIKKIQEAKYFTVLADETMDISGIEEMSL